MRTYELREFPDFVATLQKLMQEDKVAELMTVIGLAQVAKCEPLVIFSTEDIRSSIMDRYDLDTDEFNKVSSYLAGLSDDQIWDYAHRIDKYMDMDWFWDSMRQFADEVIDEVFPGVEWAEEDDDFGNSIFVRDNEDDDDA